MKTILAFSDSHNSPLPQKLKDVAAESDFLFFLGDGSSGLKDLLLHKNFHAVDGNCDKPAFGKEEIIETEGLRILITHGHVYSVKRSLLPLTLRAKELQCDVVFYGHTHIAAVDECDGITMICPGSVAYSFNKPPSYAYAVAHNGKITIKIVNIS